MASSPMESFSSIVALNDVISCVWCRKQQLTQLVQLGCFHLCCKSCLQRKLDDPRPGTPFDCPECDMPCIVPVGGLGKFPDEPLQHNMKQITAIFSNCKPNCKFCEQVNVECGSTSVCITCKINLCKSDAKRHQGTPGHEVINYEELCSETNLSLMLKSKANVCLEHCLEKTYFCKTCQHQICPDCVISYHPNHEKDSLKNIATGCRTILEENIGKIIKTKRKALENIQELEKSLSEIQENCREAGVKLQQEKNTKECLQKLKKETKIRKNQINFQINEVKNKIKQCDSAESYIKVFLKFSSDSDVTNKFREFLSNLENCEIIRESKGACAKSDNKQAIVLDEKVNESKGSERKKPIGWELEVTWKDDTLYSLSVCGGEFLVVMAKTLEWFTMDGRWKKEIKCCELGIAWDVEVCDCEVFVSDKEKRAVLVFERNGKMKRKLCLPENENGVDGGLGLAVDRMSKDIYVSSSGTKTVYKCQEGSQQFIPWITNGLNGPEYLCVAPDHHLVVSNAGSHTVIKYNPEGKLVWRYGSCRGSCKGQLSVPFGVCTDPWGYIFIADYSNDRVVVVSEEGHHVMDVDIGEKILGPWTVSFGNERLITTGYPNHQIYVIKGKYKRKHSKCRDK